MSIIAVIPARGGSKRIPRKNIKPFLGKPIISYSIETALESNLFDKVIVSTDDEEIAKISKRYGAEVPFLRPIELSNDKTVTNAVIRHSIKWMKKEDLDVSAVCCIYATAPFIGVGDLIKAYENFQSNDWEYVFSATKYSHPIQRSFRLKNDKSVEMFYPDKFAERSQELEQAYHDAGQFYWGKTDAWLNNKVIF